MFKILRKINLNSKKNIITFIDIFIIVGIFFFLKNYYKLTAPTEVDKVKDKIKYILKIDSYKYDSNDIMFINLGIKNTKKKVREFEIRKETVMNFEVYKEGKLIYKKDIVERDSMKKSWFRLGGYSRKNLGTVWNLTSFEGEKLSEGEYKLVVYVRDMNVEMTLKFIVENR